MNALTTTTTAPAQKAQRAAAGASRRSISAKSANRFCAICCAAMVPLLLVFIYQVATDTLSPWVAYPLALAVCLPAFLPAVEPETKKGGAQ